MTDNKGSSGHLCRSQLSSQSFHLHAELAEGTTTVTVLNGLVSFHRGPVIRLDDESELLQFGPRDSSHLLQLVEACSGLEELD